MTKISQSGGSLNTTTQYQSYVKDKIGLLFHLTQIISIISQSQICCCKEPTIRFLALKLLIPGSPDASMSSVLWAKTQQLQEDAFRQLQNIYGERRKIFSPPAAPDNDLFCHQSFLFDRNLQKEEQSSRYLK